MSRRPGLALALALALAPAPALALTPACLAPASLRGAPAPIPEAEARALLQAWLDAQNTARFGAYARLYAPRFFGVKRAGPRVARFNRKGWLADRKKMFLPQVRVEAAEVTVRSVGGQVVVGFVQTWRSGKFEDRGPKQLVLVRGKGGKLAIAREEMLSSTLLRGTVPLGPLAPEHFRFVVTEGGPYVVLQAGVEEALAGPGEPTVLSLGVTRRPAGEVPAEAKAWIGREVALHGSAGELCRAKIADLHVLSRVRPHFGVVQGWTGSEGEPPPPPVEVAREAWALASAGRLLVGRVEVASGACVGTAEKPVWSGAAWARASDAPAAPPMKEVPVPPALEARAFEAFRRLPAYGAIQKGYLDTKVEDTGGQRTRFWDEYGTATPQPGRVRAFADASGRPALLLLSAQAGYGCGDFWGSLWAAWSIDPAKPEGPLTLLSDAEAPGELPPVSGAVDVDGDGRPELVGPEGLVREVKEEAKGPSILREVERLPFPDYDCPC